MQMKQYPNNNNTDNMYLSHVQDSEISQASDEKKIYLKKINTPCITAVFNKKGRGGSASGLHIHLELLYRPRIFYMDDPQWKIRNGTTTDKDFYHNVDGLL